MAKGSKRKISDSRDKPAQLLAVSVSSVAFLRRPAVHCLIIAVLGILIYSHTFNFPFAFDDTPSIVNNQTIRDFRHFITPSLANISQVRFIGFASFALNYKLNGLNVTGYHVFNLLIHLLNALFVYGIVFLTVRSSDTSGQAQQDILKAPTPYYWIPLFTALLFVCHPVQTQAVTYIVQRFASLATLFYLLALLLYIKSRHSEAQPARYSFYLASLLAAILAMKTKEIAFTLPIMIMLYEFLFVKGSINKRIFYLAPFLLTMLIIPLTLLGSKGSVASFSAMDEITRSAGIQGVSRWDYLNTQFRVIVTYIRLLFFPINQNLDYDYPIYRTFFNHEVLLSFLFLLALLGWGAYLFYVSARAQKGTRLWLRMVSFGIFWFFVTLSVESSFIPIIDVIFEHRVYLPSVGFFIALVAGIFLAQEKLAMRNRAAEKILVLVMIAVVIGLSMTAYARNMVWQNDGTLWADVIKKSPNKARPHYNLGLFYQIQDRPDEAINAYQAAIELKPNYAQAHSNLGAAYLKQGRLDAATVELQTAIKLESDFPEAYKAYNNLGGIYFTQGRFDDAVKSYQYALKLKPDHTDAWFNLGFLHQTRGRLDDSIKAYETMIKLKPDSADAYNNMGWAYFNQGRFDEAIKAYQAAIILKPDYAEAHYNLGLLYHKQGRFDEALKSYQVAIKLIPAYVDAHNNMGGAYVVMGRLDEAYREFQAVLKIDPNHKDARNNLEALSRSMKKNRNDFSGPGLEKKNIR